MNRLNGLGMNLIGAVTRAGVNGVQLSGLANVNGGSLRGLQAAGITNINGHDLAGLSLAGLISINGNKAQGVIASGLANITGDESRGVLLGGLLTVAGEDAAGFHFAGLANLAGKDFCGISTSGLLSIAGNDLRGMQLTGLGSITGSDLTGVQLSGLGNVTGGTLTGMQIGAVNLAGRAKGVQIGLFNYYKEDFKGIQLGLVNANPHTRTQLLVSGGNTTKINLAARFKNNRLYTILGAGAPYFGFDDPFSGSLFYRAGAELPLYKHLFVSGDLGYAHIETFRKNNTSSPARLYSLQTRINLEYRLSDRMGLFVSGDHPDPRFFANGVKWVFSFESTVEIGTGFREVGFY